MKTWFITGASRGFGLRVARLALAQGDNVVATARQAETVVEALGEHPNLLALRLGVTDDTRAHAAAAAAAERFGAIDVLLNNAGFGLLGAVEEASAADVERLYRTNVFGLLGVTRAVLPYMRAQRSGRILNISSIGGYRGAAGFGVYSSTKFAVEGLSEALHAELAPLGIHVTVIEPGYFRTDFLDSSSLSISASRIEDYSATAGAVRGRAVDLNHSQPGDPDKLARVLVEFADAPNPPVRLPLGSDTVAAIEAKHASDAAILAQWRPVSLSTDLASACEPRRVFRRLYSVTGRSHHGDDIDKVFARAAGAGGENGAGAWARGRVAVGGDPLGRDQARLHVGDAQTLGAAGRARRWHATGADERGPRAHQGARA